MLSHVNATINGLHTIRVFNMEKQLTEEFYAHCDHYNGAAYTYYSTLGFVISMATTIAALFNSAVMFICVTLFHYDLIGM